MNKGKNKISKIEKVIINWATLPEAFGSWAMSKITKQNFEFDPYLKDGILKGIYNQKIDDYKRLIDFEGDKNRGLKMYNKTPCGRVIGWTYKVFR